MPGSVASGTHCIVLPIAHHHFLSMPPLHNVTWTSSCSYVHDSQSTSFLQACHKIMHSVPSLACHMLQVYNPWFHHASKMCKSCTPSLCSFLHFLLLHSSMPEHLYQNRILEHTKSMSFPHCVILNTSNYHFHYHHHHDHNRHVSTPECRTKSQYEDW